MIRLRVTVGKAIKLARIEAGLTQNELASKWGTKQSYISRIEKGVHDMELDTFQHIAEKGLGKKIIIRLE